MTPLEMSPDELKKLQEAKPKVPVRLVPTLIAVLADGRYQIAAESGVLEGELFRFEFPIIYVACSEGFVPEAGRLPATAYLQDKPFVHGRQRLNMDETRHSVDWVAFNDGMMGDHEEYGLYLALEVPGANSAYAHCMAETRMLDGMVRHELVERGYRQQYVK